MSESRTHILPLRNYMYVGAALLLLTAITVSAAQIDFGSWNIAIALSIAAIKASLVALFFMHLKYDNKIYAMIFLMAILFLALFITLTMFDTSQRGRLYQITENPIRQYALIYDESGKPTSLKERQGDGGGTFGRLSNFELEHGIGPIKEEVKLGSIDVALAANGKEIFYLKCSSCHKMDVRHTGPPLRDVTKRRTSAFILNQILNPEENVKRHPEGQKMLAEYYIYMTFQNVSVEDAYALLEYLRLEGEQEKQ